MRLRFVPDKLNLLLCINSHIRNIQLRYAFGCNFQFRLENLVRYFQNVNSDVTVFRQSASRRFQLLLFLSGS